MGLRAVGKQPIERSFVPFVQKIDIGYGSRTWRREHDASRYPHRIVRRERRDHLNVRLGAGDGLPLCGCVRKAYQVKPDIVLERLQFGIIVQTFPKIVDDLACYDTAAIVVECSVRELQLPYLLIYPAGIYLDLIIPCDDSRRCNHWESRTQDHGRTRGQLHVRSEIKYICDPDLQLVSGTVKAIKDRLQKSRTLDMERRRGVLAGPFRYHARRWIIGPIYLRNQNRNPEVDCSRRHEERRRCHSCFPSAQEVTRKPHVWPGQGMVPPRCLKPVFQSPRTVVAKPKLRNQHRRGIEEERAGNDGRQEVGAEKAIDLSLQNLVILRHSQSAATHHRTCWIAAFGRGKGTHQLSEHGRAEATSGNRTDTEQMMRELRAIVGQARQ